VLARALYRQEVAGLVAACADSVYSGEGEVALAIVEDILDRWAQRRSRSTGSAPGRIGSSHVTSA
jgi:hypothetical protein